MQAAMRSWSIPPAATFVIVLAVVIYLRGWLLLRRAAVPFVPPWRASVFLLGMLTLWIALASPMDVLNGFVLTAHMLQHMLLMMVVPPLLLLGSPLIPLLRGLPVFAAREFAGPFLNWPLGKQIGRTLTNPIVALLLMGITMFAWHIPAAYEMALRSSTWHQVEHACFLLASLIFWWPIVQPWPTQARWQRWGMVPYLLIADLQNTALSAILIFSDRVLYPSYAIAPRLFGLSPQQDQAAAGAIMWVLGSVVFVIPAVVIAIQCLSRKALPTALAAAVPRTPATSWDLSRFAIPGVGAAGRLPPRAREAIWFVILFAATGLLFARLSGGSPDDDQVLRFSGESGPFAVSVFSPPGELPEGPVEFSILAQDRSTREVLLDATAVLSARPAANETADCATVRTSYEASENKLLQSGELSLAAPGAWMLRLVIERSSQSAEFSMPIRVVKEEAKSGLPRPCLWFLFATVGLILVYFRRHRGTRDKAGVP